MRVTGADVARASGVSLATVSFVLNDTPGTRVSQSTSLRVREAAQRLGYVPSAPARALRVGRTNVVVLHLVERTGPVIVELIEDVTTALAADGLRLLVEIERAGPAAQLALWREVSAAVVVTVGQRIPDRDAMAQAGVRLVQPSRSAFDAFRRDIGRMQVEYLASRGHRLIAYAGTSDEHQQVSATPRVVGAQRACAALRLPAPDVRLISLDIESASEAVQHWAGMKRPPTAICTYSDEYAFAIQAAMRRVGTSFAVVGVDDTPLAQFASPPLTTVRMDMSVLAGQIVRGVRTVLGGRRAAPLRPPSLELIVRESA